MCSREEIEESKTGRRLSFRRALTVLTWLALSELRKFLVRDNIGMPLERRQKPDKNSVRTCWRARDRKWNLFRHLR